MDDTRTNMDIATNAPLMDVNTSIITKIHTPIQPNRSIQTHIGTPTHNYTSVIISENHFLSTITQILTSNPKPFSLNFKLNPFEFYKY